MGPGRPGWHIECSTLCLRELGTTIDLHGGGSDLIFPHHECEAAQSEAATGQPLVRHWMHQAMVHMDGEKMSKSLGNLAFVSELSQQFHPMAIRLGVLGNHYRTEWEFGDDLMPDAQQRWLRWQQAGTATVVSTRSAPHSTTISIPPPPSPQSMLRSHGVRAFPRRRCCLEWTSSAEPTPA